MHVKDYKRAQSIMKIHGVKQVYFYAGRIFLTKSKAPKNSITIKQENDG